MTMRRLWAILGSFLFLCAAPGIVAGLIPWWISGWERASPLFAYAPVLGAGLIAGHGAGDHDAQDDGKARRGEDAPARANDVRHHSLQL